MKPTDIVFAAMEQLEHKLDPILYADLRRPSNRAAMFGMERNIIPPKRDGGLAKEGIEAALDELVAMGKLEEIEWKARPTAKRVHRAWRIPKPHQPEVEIMMNGTALIGRLGEKTIAIAKRLPSGWIVRCHVGRPWKRLDEVSKSIETHTASKVVDTEREARQLIVECANWEQDNGS